MAEKTKKTPEKIRYTDDQRRLIDRHIGEHFGLIGTFFENTDEDRIKLEINVIPASRKNPYVTLITTGAGAHVMKSAGRRGGKLENRAEFVLYMPPNWSPESDDDDAIWAVRLLDLIANFAAEDKTWLSWGHTIDYGESFVEQTGFRGIMLLMADAGEESWHCKLSDKEKVTFYQVIPLFEHELKFAVKIGVPILAERMDNDIRNAADSDRKPYVPENFEDILDTVEEHSGKIEKKELDIPEINGANHISAFLRWMIDHDMINEEFLDYFDDEFSQIEDGSLDVRDFLMSSLDGELNKELFTDEGKAFSGYYYDFYGGDDYPCYPSDVDSMALDYFGEERYNCDEFQDEAYLFVPYGDEYYERMSAYIDKAYERFNS